MPTRKAAPKNQNPVRYRAARRDASVASIIKRIEKDYKLPEGCVRFYMPSGRRAHSDGSILNLLNRWAKA